jgi:two-component system cell cycle sensor histidine kinase/response regulator CckA
VGSDTGSPLGPELGAALHRLRSTLARLKAELELTEIDGAPAPVAVLQKDVAEAFEHLRAAEDAVHGSGRVLVVDDDVRLAELTARGLRRLGYEADSSTTLRALKPREVLVFDLGLSPGLDAAALGTVQASRPIVVTGATDTASRALASRLDASDYLVKPVDPEELAAAVSRRVAEGWG